MTVTEWDGLESGSNEDSRENTFRLSQNAINIDLFDLYVKHPRSKDLKIEDLSKPKSTLPDLSLTPLPGSTEAICPTSKDFVAIPTQLPYGKTNLADCTQYERGSKAVENFKEVNPAVVKITGDRISNGKHTTPYASGFFVTNDGMVATDLHTLRGLKNVSVKTTDGKTYDASVVAVDRRFDIAILKIDNALNRNFHALKLAPAATVKPDDIVTGWGFPLDANRVFMSPSLGLQERTTLKSVIETGLGKPLSAAELNQFLIDGERADREMLDSTMLSNYGNSGGPLTDKYNRAVGILTLSDLSHQAFSTPAEPLINLLDFALKERGKPDAKIYFDEEDVTGPNAGSYSVERMKLRSERLELWTNLNSLKLKPLYHAQDNTSTSLSSIR